MLLLLRQRGQGQSPHAVTSAPASPQSQHQSWDQTIESTGSVTRPTVSFPDSGPSVPERVVFPSSQAFSALFPGVSVFPSSQVRVFPSSRAFSVLPSSKAFSVLLSW